MDQEVDPDGVLGIKAYLSRIRVWPPIPEDMNPTKWLSGFADEHRGHAVALLDGFTLISTRQARKIFSATVQSLSNVVSVNEVTYADKKRAWNDFLDRAIFTSPTGETPSTADSGYAFHRLARDHLGISEDNLVHPSALKGAIEHALPSAVLFIDDFAGSGTQFLDTWDRPEWAGQKTARELLDFHQVDVYYLPLVATSYAIDRIEREAPSVRVHPGHVLPEEYSVVHPKSVVMPDTLRATSERFIREASSIAGLTEDVMGFHDLALAFAFEDSTPDASVALIWSTEGSWYPLKAKA